MSDRVDVTPVHEHPGVWHKDGALAQIEHMATWAERGKTGDGIGPETAGKIAINLRAAIGALRSQTGLR